MHGRIEQLLNSLPLEAGPADGWSRVQAGLAARERAGRRRVVASLVAMAASLGVFTVLLVLWGEGQQDPSRPVAGALSPPASVTAPASVAALQQQSQALEQVLAEMPARPAGARAATALPIETLEAQVQWLDHRLSLTRAEANSGHEAQQLWRERVEVMDSLVRLRYAEAQRINL
jgi:hypothetical protein